MKKITIIILWILPIVIALFSFIIGRYNVDIMNAIKILISQIFPMEKTWTTMQETVILQIRLPRILLALLIGSGLAISGASFQGMFGNPLVSPDILGVSAGAGFGASLAILISGQGFIVQIIALFAGLGAIFLTYIISGIRKNAPIVTLVLAGVVTSALFQALISLTKFVADPEEKLPAITYWLMGSFGTASYRDLYLAGPLILIGTIILYLIRWRINLLTLPEDEAKSLGISVVKLKWVVIFASTLITAASVAVAGIIGWVGLIIPHIARMIVENNNQLVFPVCISIGASYLLFVDNIARSITATEIPLSILTAIIGAPIFAYLLHKARGIWT